jgi:hypothetical protein
MHGADSCHQLARLLSGMACIVEKHVVVACRQSVVCVAGFMHGAESCHENGQAALWDSLQRNHASSARR